MTGQGRNLQARLAIPCSLMGRGFARLMERLARILRSGPGGSRTLEVDMRTAWLVLAALAAFPASAADELKIIKLEQDVRNLERQVQGLNRELAQLRSQLARAGDRRLPSRPTGETAPLSTDWLSAAQWDRIRTGMSELEVISTLGPPVSMRVEDDARVLLYAMEIGTNGFLSGSVTLRDRQVAAVERPMLK